MARENAFKVEGVILEVLSEKTYRVELANGHRLLGFVPGSAKPGMARFASGEKVQLQLSPFDLSEGRILVERQKI
jgi:translation initiation factor IF-1